MKKINFEELTDKLSEIYVEEFRSCSLKIVYDCALQGGWITQEIFAEAERYYGDTYDWTHEKSGGCDHCRWNHPEYGCEFSWVNYRKWKSKAEYEGKEAD